MGDEGKEREGEEEDKEAELLEQAGHGEGEAGRTQPLPHVKRRRRLKMISVT